MTICFKQTSKVKPTYCEETVELTWLKNVIESTARKRVLNSTYSPKKCLLGISLGNIDKTKQQQKYWLNKRGNVEWACVLEINTKIKSIYLMKKFELTCQNNVKSIWRKKSIWHLLNKSIILQKRKCWVNKNIQQNILEISKKQVETISL